MQHLGYYSHYSHWNIPSTLMFIVLDEHQRPFWHSSLFMPLLLIDPCRCTLLDLLFMYVYLHVLHVLDDSGFSYEHLSELPSERSDLLTDQHSELIFWSSKLVHEFNVLWFLISWYDLNLVPVLVKHSRAQVKYQGINQSPFNP